MSVDENDERRTYSLLSLLKLAYLALTPEQDHVLSTNFKGRLNVDVQDCCKYLRFIIKFNEGSHDFNPLGDRRHMFNRLSPQGVVNFIISHSAVKFGHIECLKLAHQIGFPIHMTNDEMNADSDVLEEQLLTGSLNQGICTKAALYGHLNCLEYAHQQRFPWDVTTCTAAVQGGNFDCLKFAVERGCPLDRSTPANAAASVGNFRVLKYLHEHGCPWSVETCSTAAMGGHLECLGYMQANGCPWDVSTCTEAVKSGNFDCLQFAVEKGCPLNSPKLTDEAASIGNLPILKYLLERGCSWSVNTCAITALSGHLECLKYERANGCPWDSSTFTAALMYMHMKCCLFCTRNNYSWDESVCIEAMYSNKVPECINYAWRNGCPWRGGTCLAGTGDGRMDCLLSEPDHNCMWDSECFNGYAAILRKTRSISSAQIVYLLFNCD